MRLTTMMLALAAALPVMGAAATNVATIVDNANGYTLNAAGRLVRFAALAYDGEGKIIAVGSSKAVAAKAPAGATRIDMQGKTVLPGLID
eukprot:gene30526-34456_t